MGIEQALGKVLKWMSNNITLMIIIFTFVIQITPIKWNPWTSFFHWLGDKLTKEPCKKMDSLITKVEEIELNVNENEKDRIRWEILDFANSCRNGRKHTKDEFEHIITLNKKYKKILAKTSDENGVFEMEYDYIKKLYAKRLEKNDFLTSSGDPDLAVGGTSHESH